MRGKIICKKLKCDVESRIWTELQDDSYFVTGNGTRRERESGAENFLVRGRIKKFPNDGGVGGRNKERKKARIPFTRNETRSIYGKWRAVSRKSFY